MDFERFFENIGKEYKTMLLALAFIFPVAYTDCWKLSSSFPHLELFPQIILALGVSVLLMLGGVVLDIVYQACTSNEAIDFKLTFPLLIMPTVPPSFFTFIRRVNSVDFFWVIEVGMIIFLFCIFLIRKSVERFKKKGN